MKIISLMIIHCNIDIIYMLCIDTFYVVESFVVSKSFQTVNAPVATPLYRRTPDNKNVILYVKDHNQNRGYVIQYVLKY